MWQANGYETLVVRDAVEFGKADQHRCRPLRIVIIAESEEQREVFDRRNSDCFDGDTGTHHLSVERVAGHENVDADLAFRIHEVQRDEVELCRVLDLIPVDSEAA